MRLYRSMRRGDCRINYLCSEGIPRWSWIQTGNDIASFIDDAHMIRRSPFNDSLIASGSDDGKVVAQRSTECPILAYGHRHLYGRFLKDSRYVRKRGRSRRTYLLWQNSLATRGIIIFAGPEKKIAKTKPCRKVGHVLFNPAAENILATSSGDYTVKIWDVESGSPRLTLKHADIVQSLSWSANGSQLVTTSRDKKLRVWDVRQAKPAHVVPGHAGAKNSRVVWMGEHDRVATTGFSKMSDRQLGLWDIRDPKEPIGGFEMLDSISGVCIPFWDDGTQCLYLAGKGLEPVFGCRRSRD